MLHKRQFKLQLQENAPSRVWGGKGLFPRKRRKEKVGRKTDELINPRKNKRKRGKARNDPT